MGADGGARPQEGVGRSGIFADLHAVHEEVDARCSAGAAAHHGGDGHARGIYERLVRGGSGDIDDVERSAVGGGDAIQREIEANVRAGAVGLMNFGGDEVVPSEQAGEWQGLFEISAGFHGAAGGSGIGRRSAGHVVAENFGAIQIDHHAVIAPDAKPEAGEATGFATEKVLRK